MLTVTPPLSPTLTRLASVITGHRARPSQDAQVYTQKGTDKMTSPLPTFIKTGTRYLMQTFLTACSISAGIYIKPHPAAPVPILLKAGISAGMFERIRTDTMRKWSPTGFTGVLRGLLGARIA